MGQRLLTGDVKVDPAHAIRPPLHAGTVLQRHPELRSRGRNVAVLAETTNIETSDSLHAGTVLQRHAELRRRGRDVIVLAEITHSETSDSLHAGTVLQRDPELRRRGRDVAVLAETTNSHVRGARAAESCLTIQLLSGYRHCTDG